jgi:hypothetical protein
MMLSLELSIRRVESAINTDAMDNSTWELCTSPLNLERAASAIISLYFNHSTKTKLSIYPNFGLKTIRQEESPQEVKMQKSRNLGEILLI